MKTKAINSVVTFTVYANVCLFNVAGHRDTG